MISLNKTYLYLKDIINKYDNADYTKIEFNKKLFRNIENFSIHSFSPSHKSISYMVKDEDSVVCKIEDNYLLRIEKCGYVIVIDLYKHSLKKEASHYYILKRTDNDEDELDFNYYECIKQSKFDMEFTKNTEIGDLVHYVLKEVEELIKNEKKHPDYTTSRILTQLSLNQELFPNYVSLSCNDISNISITNNDVLWIKNNFELHFHSSFFDFKLFISGNNKIVKTNGWLVIDNILNYINKDVCENDSLLIKTKQDFFNIDSGCPSFFFDETQTFDFVCTSKKLSIDENVVKHDLIEKLINRDESLSEVVWLLAKEINNIIHHNDILYDKR